MSDHVVPQPINSRYKDTPKLYDSQGRVFMDLWVEPGEVAADRDSTMQALLLPSDVGRLDLTAQESFQTPIPWWAIASVNGIRDQVEDMQVAVEEDPRKMLVIPRTVAVQAFLTRR